MPNAYILAYRFGAETPNVTFHVGAENAHAIAYVIAKTYVPALQVMGNREAKLEIFRGKDVLLMNNERNEAFHVSVKDSNWERIEFYDLVEDLKAAMPAKEAQFNEPTETDTNA